MNIIIQACNLHKIYPGSGRDVNALAGVDLTVEQGEALAVMGPSGSGKSTLLHILGCLDKPCRGSYFLDGKNVSGLSDRKLSRIRASRIGFVFQSFNLIPQFSVLENVTMPFMYQNKKLPDTEKKGERVLEKVGLAHRMYHKPNQLSGGELQRAAIARALVVDPLLILADEPTGNLDSETASDILSFFCDLHRQKRTLVIVTHNAEVASVCQRTVHMYDGRIVTQ
ncbi:MAG: ABC transporter ATP-binding protein [Desulfobacteraceae bacterium]|nr:ABC transporter ATP-binding protein [Desulfobacteraceae bacterium]